MTRSRLGPSEFYVTGTLKIWSIINELHKISVPTLLTNGAFDEATDAVVTPLFKGIPKVKWVTFAVSVFTRAIVYNLQRLEIEPHGTF